MFGDRDPAPLVEGPDPVAGSQGIGGIVNPEGVVEPDPDRDRLPAQVGRRVIVKSGV